MSQPKHRSAIEAVTNVAVGYGLALVIQAQVFPIFGFHASTTEHMVIAAIFTFVSIVRSYVLRRAFNWWG